MKDRKGLLKLALGAMAAAQAAVFAQPADVDIRRDAHPWHYEKAVTKIIAAAWTGPRTPDGQPAISGSWSNTISNFGNLTDPQGGIPNDPNGRPNGPRSERAPSRVSDPPDGQVPFQPWALAKVKEFQAHFWNPTAPQYVEPLERCAPGGIPKSLYYYGYEISQYPGYVVFTFETGSRIIHLGGKPHLPGNLKLWNGDSRGHWKATRWWWTFAT